jgi:hypothetical protein
MANTAAYSGLRWGELNGNSTSAPTATRTRDLPLRRRSLYPLSYRGLPGPLAYLGWQAGGLARLSRKAAA